MAHSLSPHHNPYQTFHEGEKIDMDEVLNAGMLENEPDFEEMSRSEEASILNNLIGMIDEKLPEFQCPPSKKKRKRHKHKRDPNKPKRSMSAFIFFANDKRQQFRELHPNMKITEITTRLAEMWKKLSDVEKEPYLIMSDRDKDRFRQEMSRYTPPSDSSSSDSDDSSERKRKKKKRKKNSKKPKRPMSSFIFFANEKRQLVRERFPDLKVTDITKALAEMWKKLSDEEKRQYQELGERDKERFKQENIEYIPSDVTSDDSSSESEDQNTKKKKYQKKKKRDPNRPKRPMSAFLHFANAKRQKLKTKHPDYKVTEIVRKLAKIWRKMPEEKRKKYEKMAEKDKARYKKDISSYVPPQSSSESSYTSLDSDSD